MTMAHEIMAIARNADDAEFVAEALCIGITQDWETCTTCWHFSDSSILQSCEGSLSVTMGILPY